MCSDNIVSKNKYNHLKTLKESLELELSTIKDFQNLYFDCKSRIDKAIPMLKELNVKLKDILKIGIDIKEISDIENVLQGSDINE